MPHFVKLYQIYCCCIYCTILYYLLFLLFPPFLPNNCRIIALNAPQRDANTPLPIPFKLLSRNRMFPPIISSKYAAAHTVAMTAGILPICTVAMIQPVATDRNCITHTAVPIASSLTFPSETNKAAPAVNRNVSSKLTNTPIATLMNGLPVCPPCLTRCFFIRYLPFRFILLSDGQKNTWDFLPGIYYGVYASICLRI